MKVVNTPQTSTIHISEVNQTKHIVVAIIDGRPTILGKGYHELNEQLSFLILGTDESYENTITRGNGYSYTSKDDNVEKMILQAMNNGNKLEVFEKQDWRQALLWLINNAQ